MACRIRYTDGPTMHETLVSKRIVSEEFITQCGTRLRYKTDFEVFATYDTYPEWYQE